MAATKKTTPINNQRMALRAAYKAYGETVDLPVELRGDRDELVGWTFQVTLDSGQKQYGWVAANGQVCTFTDRYRSMASLYVRKAMGYKF